MQTPRTLRPRPSGAATLRTPLRALSSALVIALGVGLLWGNPAPRATAADEPSAEGSRNVAGRGIAEPTLRLRPTGPGVAALDVDLSSRLSRVGRSKRWRTRVMRTSGFTMLGVTWAGRATEGEPVVRARVRSPQGWRRWQVLPHQHDQPQAREDTGAVGTQPFWFGRSRAVQVEIRGTRPARPTLALIDPDAGGRTPVGRPAVTSPSAASAAAGRAAQSTVPRPKSAPMPAMYSRRQWGANPRWRNGSPRYSRTIRQVHIHHTASSLRYSRADVPGILRGFYRYHTHSLGWFDIGYNFLVDRFGRTWAGRSGGPRRNVIGAHTRGFNHASMGVAVIGNFERRTPRRKVFRALANLSAWKLDRYNRKPRASTRRISHGSDRYPSGRRVWLKVIDGHRDTNQTACPGTALYERIWRVRRIAARRVHHFS